MEEEKIQAIENKKRYLRRYRNNQSCINRLENKLRRLDDRLKSVKSPTLSGMPRGGTPITIDELMSDKLELEERINRLKRKRKTLRTEILDDIDSLEDPRYCEVLEAYFIDCLSLEDIAENEGYTVRHIYRLYSEAISILAVTTQ